MFPWYFWIVAFPFFDHPLNNTFSIVTACIFICAFITAYIFIYKRLIQESDSKIGALAVCLLGIIMGTFVLVSRIYSMSDLVLNFLILIMLIIALIGMVFSRFENNTLIKECIVNVTMAMAFYSSSLII